MIMSEGGSIPKIYRISPLRDFRKNEVSKQTQASLTLVNDLLEAYRFLPWDIYGESLKLKLKDKAILNNMKHPLCLHFTAMGGHSPISGRTYAEHTKYKHALQFFDQALKTSSYEKICEFLCGVNLLVGGDGLIRKAPTGLTPDKHGRVTLFADCEQLESGLVELWDFIRRSQSQEIDLYNGLISIVGLLNCHPFADGNGRVARVLLNLILRRSSENYIPFYDFYHCTPGGYLLRLRQAQLFGDWDDLVMFHCNAIKILAGYEFNISEGAETPERAAER